MASIVHTDRPVVEHYHTDSDSSGTGILVGIVLLAVLAFLFFYFGLPLIQNATQTPAISVPERVDVNVNQPVQ